MSRWITPSLSSGRANLSPCRCDDVLTSLLDDPLHPPHPPHPGEGCNNGGLAYAVQDSPFQLPTSFDVTYFHSKTPAQTGFTTKLGFANQNAAVPYSINGGTPILTGHIAVNYRGYFTPPTSGVYTLSWEAFDDIAFFWAGPSAFNGAYTNANALSSIIYQATPIPYKITLDADLSYPMRFLAANTGGPTNFAASLTAPDGTTVLISSYSTANMPWFTQFSCNGKKYPAFQDFGKET